MVKLNGFCKRWQVFLHRFHRASRAAAARCFLHARACITVPVAAVAAAARQPNNPCMWVVDHMINLGFSKSLSEWIGSNLKKDNEHVTWAFDLQAAIDMFNSYRERSYWTLLENPPKGLDIAIVQAELSDRWLSDDVQRLKALSRRESKPDADPPLILCTR
uniref:Uncharacterized protein n=1 Tax=Oryza glumipatula TaxID=40148 RepID=A0A0D9YHS4_9ORYZ